MSHADHSLAISATTEQISIKFYTCRITKISHENILILIRIDPIQCSFCKTHNSDFISFLQRSSSHRNSLHNTTDLIRIYNFYLKHFLQTQHFTKYKEIEFPIIQNDELCIKDSFLQWMNIKTGHVACSKPQRWHCLLMTYLHNLQCKHCCVNQEDLPCWKWRHNSSL
jgi:hypothetical protein